MGVLSIVNTTLLRHCGCSRFVMSCGVGEYGRLGLGDMASDATSPEPIEYIDNEQVILYTWLISC